jgi:hypothetical protein
MGVAYFQLLIVLKLFTAVSNSFRRSFQSLLLVIIEVSTEPYDFSTTHHPKLTARMSNEVLVVAHNDQSTTKVFDGLHECVDTSEQGTNTKERSVLNSNLIRSACI